MHFIVPCILYSFFTPSIASLLQCLIAATLECHGKLIDKERLQYKKKLLSKRQESLNVVGSMGFEAVICSPYSTFFSSLSIVLGCAY